MDLSEAELKEDELSKAELREAGPKRIVKKGYQLERNNLENY